MAEPWEADPAVYFRRFGYVPIRSLLSAAHVGFLDRVARLEVSTGRYAYDGSQVVGSRVAYGNAVFETVLGDLIPDLVGRLGIDLRPTYSFVRSYLQGMDLAPHTDRPACEISVTVHLGSDDGLDWPLLLTDTTEETISISLKPGDGVVYLGCDIPHWRDPCPSIHYRQAFFHYVEAEGKYDGLQFDERPGLGQPAPRSRQHAGYDK